jgi:IS30 family transposase
LRIEVERMLAQGYTPEQIAGRLPLVYPGLPTISHEAIYQWIYAERLYLTEHLPRRHQHRWPKGKSRHRRPRHFHLPERVPLSQRPQEANDRTQPGHWETDLIVGPGTSALQVSVERTTRYVRIVHIPDKSAPASRDAVIRSLADMPSAFRRSITYDNGSENHDHLLVNKELETKSYFCEPYHSWEKGAVENTNGVIRRRFPKRTNFDMIPLADIQAVESWLNNRPRKCLDFLTPSEALAKTVALTP